MKQLSRAEFKYYHNGEAYFPAIPLYISTGDKQLKLRALIDSGATISILRHEVAEELGIIIEQGEEIYLGGVGGRIKGFIHEVNLDVVGKLFRCPVVFSREYLVSFNLLGRQGFFERFMITFDEKHKRLLLT